MLWYFESVIDITMAEILFVGYSLKPYMGFSYNFKELSDLWQKSVDYSILNSKRKDTDKDTAIGTGKNKVWVPLMKV